MQQELYRELWTLRFQKMLELEEEAIDGYQELLEESQKKYADDPELQNDLKTLIADEKKHAKLVSELLSIVQRQKD